MLLPPSLASPLQLLRPTSTTPCGTLSANGFYVNLNRGMVPLKDEGDAGFEKDLKFQRGCVRIDDGGVISMDWPDFLDLEREQGLDTTVLIIPRTPDGSMDRKVRLFVIDVVKHG